MQRILNIPDSYFEEEVRCDFKIVPMMKRCWAASMEILMQIDRICRRHGIKYRAAYGTLLGAVRHHGFIPWDDDIDIAMLRQDYMRFLKIAETELPAPMKLQSIYTDAGHSQPLSSVLNRTDVGKNEAINEFYFGCPFICCVDIFPFDYLPANDEELDVFLNLYTICYDVCMDFDKLFKNGELAEKIDILTEYSKVPIDYDRSILSGINESNADHLLRAPEVIALKNKLFRLLDSIASMYGPEDSDRVGSVHEQITHARKIMSTDAMTETSYQPFEMIEVPVPFKYEELLKQNYGDWQVLHREYTGMHDYPFYRRQIEYLPEDYRIKNDLMTL
jgi:lipopolysaccharide cholinephosphotransferase